MFNVLLHRSNFVLFYFSLYRKVEISNEEEKERKWKWEKTEEMMKRSIFPPQYTCITLCYKLMVHYDMLCEHLFAFLSSPKNNKYVNKIQI